MNQGSIRTIVNNIIMITPSYTDLLCYKFQSHKKLLSFFKYTTKWCSTSHTLTCHKSQIFSFPFFLTPPQCTGKCCSISHTLTCLLHNLKTHYHFHRSFPHLPIRGQTNPVHISHSIYIIPTSKKSSDVDTGN